MNRLSIALFVCSFCLTSTAHADVRLPKFFSDHMVLQQEKPINVWGWADAGENVTVSIGDSSKSVKAAADGTWKVSLDAMKASKEPLELAVNSIRIKDVLIGEVWLCSGQSNMEWSVRASSNASEEIAAANYPLIRHMKAPHRSSMTPMDDIDTQWQICSPDTVANFTACGYFMARQLHKELDVPIGLINSSWGGTRVEPWTPPVGFQETPALDSIYKSVVGRSPGTPQYKQALSKHMSAVSEWMTKAQAAMSEGTSVAASPVFPDSLAPFKSHQDPTMLYNGMIHALVGYGFRGAIWYQGESNHTEGMLYYEKKKALINGWRKLWNAGDFPFYYVQIAPFQYGNEDPTILARFWEAQEKVQELPNTGMVVINDITTLNNIHPPNKQDVGLRLANLALKHDYGRDNVVAHSPQMTGMTVSDSELTVQFENAAGGLKTRDGDAPTLFEIVGQNSGGFQPATAEIDGDNVVLTSDKVKAPTAFRFAWNKLAEPNLIGGTGLPVGACRAGTVPSFANMIPGMDNYKLVYDLDLGKLGNAIKYDVDNSANIKRFERVGYLVELDNGGTNQSVFVSMKAFTSDATKLGIPTAQSGANFQQKVQSLDVFSNVKGITTGTRIGTGNIEFWPNNYAPGNTGKVPNANSNRYDFGDSPGPPKAGYGSMQIHNYGARQTLFAINHWKQATKADIGVGNSPGQHQDWTFTGSASQYSAKRLRVFVK